MGDSKLQVLTEEPIFFERNRVFRNYLGGALFHDFFGDDLPKDTNYPEEWIASDVVALNGNDDPHEGISKIKGTDIYFNDLIKAEHERMLGPRKDLGVLVKGLDSAMRLVVQVHPDKGFAKKHFNSDYGKTESWIILATRENPKIYLGFKDKINEQTFLEAIARNETDRAVLQDLLWEIPVKAGDVFLVRGGTVHAIGAGCFMLEVQEPSDLSVLPEVWSGDYHLTERERYLGLSHDVAMKCFDYNVYGKSGENGARLHPKEYAKTASSVSETLISYDDTPCFAVNRHRIFKGAMRLQNAPAIYVITGGSGVISTKSGKKALKKGAYFFMPFALAGQCELISESEIEIIECLPSLQK